MTQWNYKNQTKPVFTALIELNYRELNKLNLTQFKLNLANKQIYPKLREKLTCAGGEYLALRTEELGPNFSTISGQAFDGFIYRLIDFKRNVTLIICNDLLRNFQEF